MPTVTIAVAALVHADYHDEPAPTLLVGASSSRAGASGADGEHPTIRYPPGGNAVAERAAEQKDGDDRPTASGYFVERRARANGIDDRFAVVGGDAEKHAESNHAAIERSRLAETIEQQLAAIACARRNSAHRLR